MMNNINTKAHCTKRALIITNNFYYINNRSNSQVTFLLPCLPFSTVIFIIPSVTNDQVLNSAEHTNVKQNEKEEKAKENIF